MALEIIGYLWVLIAALVSVFSLHATWRDWGYNINITKETSCQAKSKKQHSSSHSKQSEASSENDTSKREATWSLGAEVLERSLSIERRSKIREPAAESGSKE
tara:strand:+ start:3432 stop:3740 length:309 start_codon:yes stop_codon:yes gene_type:complete